MVSVCVYAYDYMYVCVYKDMHIYRESLCMHMLQCILERLEDNFDELSCPTMWVLRTKLRLLGLFVFCNEICGIKVLVLSEAGWRWTGVRRGPPIVSSIGHVPLLLGAVVESTQ